MGIKLDTLNVIHWNLGPRHWKNKVQDIQLLVATHKPDLAFLSEANLYPDTTAEESHIPGYSIVTTLDFDNNYNSRLVLLIREGFNTKIEKWLYGNKTSPVYGSQSQGGEVGDYWLEEFYREHQLIGRIGEADTSTIVCQKFKVEEVCEPMGESREPECRYFSHRGH